MEGKVSVIEVRGVPQNNHSRRLVAHLRQLDNRSARAQERSTIDTLKRLEAGSMFSAQSTQTWQRWNSVGVRETASKFAVRRERERVGTMVWLFTNARSTLHADNRDRVVVEGKHPWVHCNACFDAIVKRLHGIAKE